MTKTTALIAVDNERIQTALTQPDLLDALLSEVRDILDAFEPDITSAKGRQEVASIANKVARTKTAVDAIGKDMVAEVKAKVKVVDEARKKARDTLDQWKSEVRQPLTQWEEAREKSQAAIARLIEAEQNPGTTTEEIAAMVTRIKSCDIEKFCPEHHKAATDARDQALARARAALEAAQKADKEREELEALRREKAEREAKEQAERQKAAQEQAIRDAEERARKEAEVEAQRKLEAEKRQREESERRAVEAEQRAKMEQERKAREAAEAEAKRKADNEHRARVMQESAGALESFCGDVIARRIVDAIANGVIPHVSMRF